MNVSNLMRDKLKLIKKNGEIIDNLKSSVSSNMIIVMTNDTVIAPGELLQRTSSNGAEETFEVIDPVFQERFGSIPAQYTIKFKKLGVPEAENAIQNITYNFSGHNARVNNNSVDQSTNVVNMREDIKEHIDLLRGEVKRLITEASKQREALEVVDAIESQYDSRSPSKAVVSTLLSALPHAGSISSVASFLLAAIGG